MNEQKAISIIAHFPGTNNHGGTGVFAWHVPGDSFIQFATALCSEKDQYSKKVALDILEDQIENGHYIRYQVEQYCKKNMTHKILRDYINMFFMK